MGLTGSGKSSFIKLCTQLDVPIGGGLQSCTAAVCVYSFEHRGRKVHLVDTPGFNDSNRSESDVLEEICHWLSAAYGPSDVKLSQRFLLNGIIYLHPLTEQRWTGTSQRSIDFLKALCGPDHYLCIRLVTSFWDQTSPLRGTEHEQQLISAPEKWGEIVKAGSRERVFRHDSGYRSAIHIVDAIVEEDAKTALRIQEELSQPGTTLLETTVGRLAQRRWAEDIVHFEDKINEIRIGLQRRHSSDSENDLAIWRASLSTREDFIASLAVDQPALFQRWIARNSRDNERLNEQLEVCNRAIASLQRQVRAQDPSPLSISIYNHESSSAVGDNPYEQQLKHERQKQKDLITQRMARMTSHSMKAGVAGALFGGLSAGVALWPLAAGACTVM